MQNIGGQLDNTRVDLALTLHCSRHIWYLLAVQSDKGTMNIFNKIHKNVAQLANVAAALRQIFIFLFYSKPNNLEFIVLRVFCFRINTDGLNPDYPVALERNRIGNECLFYVALYSVPV